MSVASDSLDRTVLVALQKGGTTKTTSVAEIGRAAAGLGARVLLVDFAPNANLTQTLMGFDIAEGDFLTAADIIAPGLPMGSARDAVVEVPEQWQFDETATWETGGRYTDGGVLTIIPGSPLLQDVADKPVPGGDLRLQRALVGVASEFDLVLIDTDPTTGKASQLATLAAGWQIGPVLPSPGANDGALTQIRFLEAFAAGWMHPVKFAGVFVSAYDKRLTIAHGRPAAALRELLDEYQPTNPDAVTHRPIPGLDGYETGRVFPQVVPSRAAAQNAAAEARSVATVPGGLGVANVYAQLAVVLLHLVEAPMLPRLLAEFEQRGLPGVWPLDPWPARSEVPAAAEGAETVEGE